MSTDTPTDEEFDEETPEDLDKRATDVLEGEYVTFEEHNASRD